MMIRGGGAIEKIQSFFVDFITNVVFEGVRFSCKVFWNYYGSEREGRRERKNFERIFVKEIC